MTISAVSSILIICSVVTGLIVEAIKKMMVIDKPNILAAVVSVIVGIFVSIMYAIYNNLVIDTMYVMHIVSVVVLSWLCSMLGYDKVIQTLAQLRR